LRILDKQTDLCIWWNNRVLQRTRVDVRRKRRSKARGVKESEDTRAISLSWSSVIVHCPVPLSMTECSKRMASAHTLPLSRFSYHCGV
jgi:hypothetical protein